MKKIFILGKHRSGTTWLANCIAEVDGVYTPRVDLHHGQIESAFFSSIVPYFSGAKSAVDRSALYAAFSKSDFFSALGVDFDEVDHQLCPELMFEALMSAAANAQDCDAWLEKTPAHSLLVDDLMSYYPDAQFIRVRRNILDQTLSTCVGLKGTLNKKNLFVAAFESGIYEAVLSIKSDRLLEIAYEDLRNDFDREIHRCLDFLNMAERSFSRPSVKANSSFSSAYSQVKTAPSLSVLDKVIVRFGFIFGRSFPRRLIKFALRQRKTIFRNKLPRWMFASL
ncbi:sulfotransferase [Shimia sp. R9_3]|uniref:sulfotransferase family protein n=1 Tax=Shimia sp. R9_3 TaxID=2821113 RepID=UPI001AD9DB80|nr:sulfotransferase [Shimia sp. R9_3]MBO9399396.1 sulfotransferase [Shimia sp. R9_3]